MCIRDRYIVLPAIVCFVVPFFLASFNKVFKGDIESNKLDIDERAVKLLSSRTMPVSYTHLDVYKRQDCQ